MEGSTIARPDAQRPPKSVMKAESKDTEPRRGMGRAIAAGVVACLALVAGIAWGWFNRGVMVISSIDLDRTVGVAYFAPQRNSFLPWENTGILAFVYDDGSYHMVEADALNGAQPLWTDEGLIVPGDHHTRLTTAPNGHTRADSQNAPDGAAVLDMVASLGLSNGHFEAYSSGDGNVAMALTSSHGAATANARISQASGTLTSGNPSAVHQLGYAACGDDVYALIHETPATRSIGTAGISTLLHVASNGSLLDSHGMAMQSADTAHSNISDVMIGESVMTDAGAPSAPTALASTAACNAGVFSIITANSANDGSDSGNTALSLSSWDTTTGRHSVKALHGSDGGIFTLANANLTPTTAAGGSIAHDGAIYWFTASRTLNRTSLSDGVTRSISDAHSQGATNANPAVAAWFSADLATVFSAGASATSDDSRASQGDAELIAVDTSNGNTVGSLRVQGLCTRVKQFSQTMVLQGFAANPSYRWPTPTN